ncbi:peptide MFS transporter [Adhaeribacter sp. BT258]|uniref:Peptide MFS transporter n=1 Tax=Adhaeribacter terrigena TaxID=2793070 RepID=A0ABS1C0T5_9BACT|nr:peptide MFS transporter [Adhaeribacter terrigena]MBK0402945.1 peptide MFS transporter [Adhaeribacter terrigena]
MSVTTQQAQVKQGHPKGLYLLFMTEMWERFSYYGMRALLMLYLVNETSNHLGGRGWTDGNAGMLYGWFTGFVYLTPIIGGWLADNYIGQRKAITIGGILMMLGQFSLFSELNDMTFYLGLGLLIIGNGFFKANISTIVGKLYDEGDVRRDSAFTIFYMGINTGAFIAPLVCGYLGATYGYRYGFLAAGIGMMLGQIMFNTMAQSYLGNIGKFVAKTAEQKAAPKTKLTKQETDRVAVILVLTLFVIFFWAGFEQAGSSLSLYTERYIDRVVFGWEIPTAWFQSVNPLFIVALAPIISSMWISLASKGKNPNTTVKMAMGMMLLGLGFFLMVGAVMERGGDVADASIKANIWWLVGAYFLHTLGELCLSPVGLSMVTKLAPLAYASMLMGVWMLSSFVANIMGGYIVKYVEELGALTIFGGIGAFVIVLGFVLLAVSKKLTYMMHGRG